MIRQPMEIFGWLMLFTLPLVWGSAFFSNGIAVAEMLVLTILVCHLGVVCFHETGGSCDAGEPLDLVGLCLDGLLNDAIPFGLIIWA